MTTSVWRGRKGLDPDEVLDLLPRIGEDGSLKLWRLTFCCRLHRERQGRRSIPTLARSNVRLRTTTTPTEALGIVTLCFGWFIIVSLYAVSVGFRSGSFSEAGTIGLVILEIMLGIAAMYVLGSRGFDVSSLYPRPSVVGVLVGVLLAFAAATVAAGAASVFTWEHYSEPLERLMAGTPIGLPALVALGIVNGAYEEMFLLGFLLRGLREYGLSVAIGVSLLVRVLYHLYQGPVGAIYVGAFGLVLSLYYVARGNLFPAVLAHALWDIIPFVFHAP